MRMTRTMRRVAPLVVLPLLFSGTLAAHAAPAPVVVDYDDAAPIGQDMYQALNQGEAIQCEAVGCTVRTTVVSVSKAEQKYLGLSTRTVAKGVPHGPVSIRIMGAMQHGLFVLPIPAWFKKKVLAKHVVAMKVLITDSSRYSETVEGATTTYTSTFPNPDDNPKTQWGQGSRYGCQPVARGDMILGYVHFGGTCPKG